MSKSYTGVILFLSLLISLNASAILCQELMANLANGHEVIYGREPLNRLIEITPNWKPIEGSGKPERWSFDGHDGAKYYDQDFADLYTRTGQKSLSEILTHRRSDGRTNHVLDIFGSGFFVEDQSLADSITGVRLGPFSKEKTNYDYVDAMVA